MANPTGHTFKNGTVLCRGCYAGHLNLERKIRNAASSEGRDDPQSSCPASVITFKQLLRRYQTLAEVQAHGPGFPYAQECSSTTEGCPEPFLPGENRRDRSGERVGGSDDRGLVSARAGQPERHRLGVHAQRSAGGERHHQQ